MVAGGIKIVRSFIFSGRDFFLLALSVFMIHNSISLRRFNDNRRNNEIGRQLISTSRISTTSTLFKKITCSMIACSSSNRGNGCSLSNRRCGSSRFSWLSLSMRASVYAIKVSRARKTDDPASLASKSRPSAARKVFSCSIGF